MNLIFWPNPILSNLADKATEPELDKTIDDMYNILLKTRGAAISAVQVGINKAFFIDTDKNVYYNPSFVPALNSKLVEYNEGCLSFPAVRVKVRRYDTIEATWLDAQFKQQTQTLSDFESELFQHETEHSHGKTFLDLLDNGQKQYVKNWMFNLRKKGKLNA
jgi:peptide deformylase